MNGKFRQCDFGRRRWRGDVIAISIASLFAVATLPTRMATAATKHLVVNGSHPACNDSGPGSESQPLCTIQEAAHRATPGTIVHVREGTYHETVTLRRSGRRGALIKFVVDGDDHVVIDSPSYACFNLLKVRYIKISGFELMGAYGGEGTEVAHGGGIRAYPLTRTGYGAKNCVFTRNVIHDNDAGIWMVYSHRNTIMNNVIFQSDEAPIRIKRGDYNHIVNNLTFDNGLVEPWGITFYGSIGTEVRHNTVVEPTGGGIYIYEGTSNLQGAQPGTTGYCVPSSRTVVKDNICVVNGAAPGPMAPLVIGSSTTTDRDPALNLYYGPIDNTYTHNLFFNASNPQAVVSWGDFDETEIVEYYALLDLGGFQGKYPGYGASCFATDPLFQNAGAYDFSLSAASPAQGTGTGGSDIGADISQLPAFTVTAPAGSQR